MLKRLPYQFLLVFLGSIFFGLVSAIPRLSGAETIQNRSIHVNSAIASEVTSHTFQLTLPTTTNIGSIVFEYCSNSPLIYLTCSAPAGFDASSSVLATQSGNTGFSIDNTNTTTNKIVLTRPVSPGLTVPSTY